MERLKPLLDGLDRAADMARDLMHYYRHAGEQRHSHNGTHDDSWQRRMQRNMDRHRSQIGRIEMQRQRLEEAAHQGRLADLLSSITEAIQNVAIAFPLEMIVEETEPTPAVFRQREEQLIAYLEELSTIADDDTRKVLAEAIADSRANIETLDAVSS